MEYTLQDYCNRIREDVKDYDYILIGLGDEALKDVYKRQDICPKFIKKFGGTNPVNIRLYECL